jgi:drug/metabolite transporter (DMT)-like permease
MASMRFLVAGLLLAGIVHGFQGFRATPKQWFDNAIAGFLMLVGGNGLVSWAEQEIPSGVATLIIALNPVFFVLAEWLIAKFGRTKVAGERPNFWTMLGLALGFLGLLVLAGPWSLSSVSPTDIGTALMEPAPALNPWRVLALVTACISWTIGSLYNRYSAEPAEPFTGAAMQMLWGSLWLIGISLMVGEFPNIRWADFSTASVGAWLYLVVAGSLIGFTSFVWLMKHCSPTLVSTYAYVNPIVAVLLGWWLAGETIDGRVLIASAAIIVGVAIISLSKHAAKPKRE